MILSSKVILLSIILAVSFIFFGCKSESDKYDKASNLPFDNSSSEIGVVSLKSYNFDNMGIIDIGNTRYIFEDDLFLGVSNLSSLDVFSMDKEVQSKYDVPPAVTYLGQGKDRIVITDYADKVEISVFNHQISIVNGNIVQGDKRLNLFEDNNNYIVVDSDGKILVLP